MWQLVCRQMLLEVETLQHIGTINNFLKRVIKYIQHISSSSSTYIVSIGPGLQKNCKNIQLLHSPKVNKILGSSCFHIRTLASTQFIRHTYIWKNSILRVLTRIIFSLCKRFFNCFYNGSFSVYLSVSPDHFSSISLWLETDIFRYSKSYLKADSH